jgi:hypothetical protein
LLRAEGLAEIDYHFSWHAYALLGHLVDQWKEKHEELRLRQRMKHENCLVAIAVHDGMLAVLYLRSDHSIRGVVVVHSSPVYRRIAVYREAPGNELAYLTQHD